MHRAILACLVSAFLLTGAASPSSAETLAEREARERAERADLATEATRGGAATVHAVMEAQRIDAKREQEEESATNEFMGVKWGMGLAGVFDLDGGTRVEGASIVNGMVRIDEERDFQGRILLELHDFGWLPWREDPEARPLWGSGPWVGIQSSTDQVIESFALGWMMGKRKSPTATNSFNIGLGYVVDPKAKVLGGGFEADRAAPEGETEVRFKTESRAGLAVVFSTSF